MLFIVLKQSLQLLAREEDAALYRTERQAKTVGNLAILETREMHEERNAIVARQAVHHTVNLLCVIAVVGDVLLRLVQTVDVELVVGLVHEYLVPYLLTIVIDEDVAHYRIDPPLEIGVRGIFVHITQCL